MLFYQEPWNFNFEAQCERNRLNCGQLAHPAAVMRGFGCGI
jgi:hypothetical protein